MITRIQVKNFKSFEDLVLDELPRFVCLIGVNGSGKTSFIQLLTFIRALVRGNIDKWSIGEKPCDTHELAFAGSQKRNLDLIVNLKDEETKREYTWSVTYNLYEGQLVREQLVESVGRVPILTYETKQIRLNGELVPLALNPNGSALSLPIQDEHIDRIKALLSDIEGVGVLDPMAIAEAARTTRGRVRIEENGRKLSAFVGQLSAKEQEEYASLIRKFYNDFDDVSVKSAKFGWKRIVFTELKKSLDALYMSYGTLRYMVMAAFKYSPAPTLYFDEVDNGFNQEYLGKVVELLRGFARKQVFVTTHNVLFLNHLTDEELRSGVLFFYKDRRHRTRVTRFFDIEENSRALEYDAGGSIVSTTDLIELGKRLTAEEPKT